MTDKPDQSTAPVAATPEAAAPVAASPVVTETVTSEAPTDTVLGMNDAGVDAKPAEAAEIADAAKADPAAETVVPEVKPELKSADGAEKPTEAKAEEKVSQSDEPAPLPSYEPWKFPDNVTVDPSQLVEVNKMFAEFEVESKAEHALVQKFGQKILDRHVESVQAVIKQLGDAYQESWKNQTKNWYETFKNDPEIGGEKMEASQAAAREFIRRHGGTPAQQNSLREIFKTTGLGNHPDVIRVMANATANLSEGKVIPAGTPPAAPTTRKSRFYGAKK